MLSVQNNETFHDTSLSLNEKKKSHYLQKEVLNACPPVCTLPRAAQGISTERQ